VLSRNELNRLVRSSPDSIVELVLVLQQTVHDLSERINELESQLKKNSRNSSKPPSSDGLKKPKPKSLRKKSGLKVGGQAGHPGTSLKQTNSPDIRKVLPVLSCTCGSDAIKDAKTVTTSTRQVFELPEPKLQVTEYIAEEKYCPCCGKRVKADFPEGVMAPAQYGVGFKAFLAYLNVSHLLPVNRISTLCEDLYGYPVGWGTVMNAIQKSGDSLETFEDEIVEALTQVPVLHADESGIRVKGKLNWVHSASTEELTFYGVHQKRGSEATDSFNIIPRFNGTLVHDFWKTYFAYDCKHAMCNAHLLRELLFLSEECGQKWSVEFAQNLLEMKRFKENECSGEAGLMKEEKRAALLRQYRSLIEKGNRETPPQKVEMGKKGKNKKIKTVKAKPKRSKAQNLLRRFHEYENEVLRFFHDPSVPFTNNLAEQDIRMIKAKQKTSGTFRTEEGAKTFLRIRSFISTARKNGRKVYEEMKTTINGKPSLSQLTSPLPPPS